MNCREWEEAIALYAGGDLDAPAHRATRLEVERHLAECPGCQIFAGGMIECLEAMRAGHREEIAPAHFTALRSRVLARLQPAPWWRRRWLRGAALAAVALCALWLAMADRTIRRPVPPPQVALARPRAPFLTMPVRPAPPRGVLRKTGPPPRASKPAPPEEPLTVQIVTDDPDVVIYWVTNPKGE